MKILFGIFLCFVVVVFLVYISSVIQSRMAIVRSQKKLSKLFDALPKGFFAPPTAIQVSFIFDAIRFTWKEQKDGDFLIKELLGFQGFEAEYMKAQGAEFIATRGKENVPQG